MNKIKILKNKTAKKVETNNSCPEGGEGANYDAEL